MVDSEIGFDIQPWIVKFQKQYFALNYRKASELGVHPGQLHVLKMVAMHDGISQKELANLLRVKPPTVAVMVKRMEKAGLIRRVEDREDMRVMRISLTEEGKRISGKADEAMHENEKVILQGFSDEELAQLRNYFERLVENMQQETGGETLSYVMCDSK
jgi:DNA-binding MarR family transcriptional regulator